MASKEGWLSLQRKANPPIYRPQRFVRPPRMESLIHSIWSTSPAPLTVAQDAHEQDVVDLNRSRTQEHDEHTGEYEQHGGEEDLDGRLVGHLLRPLMPLLSDPMRSVIDRRVDLEKALDLLRQQL